MTPAVLHLSPRSHSSLRSVPTFILRLIAQLYRLAGLCLSTKPLFISVRIQFYWPLLLLPVSQVRDDERSFQRIAHRGDSSAFVRLFVCCRCLQTNGWQGPRHQISIHPQSTRGTLSASQEKPDFQVSHPHLLDRSPLTCANMKEGDGEREGGWKGVKWKDIPAFGYWVGRRKEYHAAEQTSVPIGPHLYTSLSLCVP